MLAKCKARDLFYMFYCDNVVYTLAKAHTNDFDSELVTEFYSGQDRHTNTQTDSHTDESKS